MTTMTLSDLFLTRAAEDPSAAAVIYRDVRVTYGELADRVESIARGFAAHGLRPGDRVLALAGNNPDVIALYLAVGRLGGVYVPVSSGFRSKEGSFAISNAEPSFVVVEEPYLDEFSSWDRADSIPTFVMRHDTGAALPDGVHDFATIGVDAPSIDPVAVDGEAGLLLCYTSGTTSTPKPVMHSVRSEVYNAMTYAQVWGLGRGTRGIVALPLAWVYGLSTTTAALLVSGGTVVLLDRFHPVDVLTAIAEHRATAIWGTMSMYTKLLEVIDSVERVDLSSLTLAVNGGEPCPPPLVKAFEERTGVTLLGSYATSEARPILVVRPGDESVPEGSVGQLVPGAQLRLEDANGNDVGNGPGHALLKCAGTMSEYYRHPELTAERLTPDGWLRSGDILHRDDNGYYFVVGRLSELIIRSGANIAPAEIESELVAHPDVADAAVVGAPDPRSGESVVAFVVPVPGAALTDTVLREYLGSRLSAYKIPQTFVCLDELPRTGRGKLDRNHLRTVAEGDTLQPVT